MVKVILEKVRRGDVEVPDSTFEEVAIEI